MLIITSYHKAKMVNGEIIVGEEIQEADREEKVPNVDDIPGSIQKMALEVASFNSEQERLAAKIHRKNPNEFRIERQRIEG
jgi:hypothetical protein